MVLLPWFALDLLSGRRLDQAEAGLQGGPPVLVGGRPPLAPLARGDNPH